MAITCIPNQAVNFCTPSVDSCGCFSGDYTATFDNTDTVSFQVDLTEDDGAELIADFSGGCGAAWTCGTNWSIAAGVASFSGAMAGSLTATASAGANDAFWRITIEYSNNVAGIIDDIDFDGASRYSAITLDGTSGTLDFFVRKLPASLSTFIFSIDARSGAFDIDSVSIKTYSFPNIIIRDSDNNIDYFQGLSNYSESTPAIDEPSVFTNEYDTVTVVQLTEIIAQGGANAYAKANIVLYLTTILLTSGDTYTIQVIETPGNTVQLTSQFKQIADWDCTHLLSWSNDSNHFGLIYDLATFVPELRICARLYHPSFDNEGDLFTDDAGTATQTFAKKTETLVLQTEPLPENIHDALSNAIIHDNFFIDGVEYVKRQGDYQPDWNKNYNLAPVRIEVSKQSNENIHNRSCS